MSKTIFKEKQRFKQVWIWLGILIGFSFFIYQYTQSSSMTNNEYLIPLVVLVFVSFLLGGLNLKTKIDENGIHVKMFPLHLSWQNYTWANLHSADVVTYSPLGDYGGWGYRISLNGKGKAFNIKGNKGIRIQTDEGKIRMIGTQKPEEAQKCIDQYFKSKA